MLLKIWHIWCVSFVEFIEIVWHDDGKLPSLQIATRFNKMPHQHSFAYSKHNYMICHKFHSNWTMNKGTHFQCMDKSHAVAWTTLFSDRCRMFHHFFYRASWVFFFHQLIKNGSFLKEFFIDLCTAFFARKLKNVNKWEVYDRKCAEIKM